MTLRRAGVQVRLRDVLVVLEPCEPERLGQAINEHSAHALPRLDLVSEGEQVLAVNGALRDTAPIGMAVPKPEAEGVWIDGEVGLGQLYRTMGQHLEGLHLA